MTFWHKKKFPLPPLTPLKLKKTKKNVRTFFFIGSAGALPKKVPTKVKKSSHINIFGHYISFRHHISISEHRALIPGTTYALHFEGHYVRTLLYTFGHYVRTFFQYVVPKYIDWCSHIIECGNFTLYIWALRENFSNMFGHSKYVVPKYIE